MTIAVGTRLGPFEVLASIGSGGMGEVYRARDLKLDREVAIKVLPEALAMDPERIARFEREAKMLAALNHPHIAHIHGLEESDGIRALVMELVDGPTLADRIAKGPIPLDEALPIAKQIADALEAAHEEGIIHRDLKPANIKVRADGTVKVLDFGLAKAFDPAASSAGGATMSPTLSVHATQAGIILGTAAYMAPEQARGKSVDKRADIWAFGCVLYEMLTARHAFEGDDISTTLAAVIKSDPEWSALPAAAPSSLRRLLHRCLHKDPKTRLRDIGEARVAIDAVLAGAVDESALLAPVRSVPARRRVAAVAGVVLITAIVTGAIARWATRSTVAPSHVWRFQIVPPSSAAVSLNGYTRSVTLTPDGSRLIYVGANGTTLFMRPLDQLELTPLVRSGGCRDPFVSPDGKWVGFFDGPQIMKKVPITGGPALTVATLTSAERGATWASDDTIIFSTAAPATGLQRLNASGGTPIVLTRPDRARGEANHLWPELLPGDQAVLYTVTATTGGVDAASLAILDLRNGRSRVLLHGGFHAQYVPSGHLVYAAAGTLRAIGFDLAHLTVVGTPVPVVPQVQTTSFGAVEARMASDGALVYVPGGTRSTPQTVVWVDRQGHETPIAAPPRGYSQPRLSPDGARIAVTVGFDQNADIAVWDLARATLARITSDPADDSFEEWSPDGHRVLFASDRLGVRNLFSQPVDTTSAVERLIESANPQIPTAVSPDGKWLLFTELSPKTGQDVMAVRLDGTRQILPLVQTPFTERNGIVSPDGHWLAYEADDSGSFEVYVRPFPDVNNGLSPVSTSGGTQPLWARSGRELFYLAPDGALMRVAVTGGPAWKASAPTKMLEGRYVVSPGGNFPRNYDIAADGRRFLMIKALGGDATGAPPQIVVVQHFDEELKRLVPVK